MHELELLIDLHLRNARQGPGGEEETRQAIALAGLRDRAGLEIADLGCGTGASTLVLAQALDARVTAVDAAPAFVQRLRERAERAGVADRVVAQVGRMESLPFDDGRFDVVWSEGAIYAIGFETGIRAWRRLLRPGGVLAVSEISWTTDSRPADVAAHWRREYPDIDTPSAKLRILEVAGYAPLGFFLLPAHCWERNYYGPLRRGFPSFMERHGHSDAARRIVAAEEVEMRLHRERGEWYGYGFYLAARCGE